MVDVERYMLSVAVDTLTSELLQQILPNFVACQTSVLVTDAGYFRIRHQMGIEADEL